MAEKSFSVASFCALASFQSVVAIQDDPHFINTLHPNISVCIFSVLFSLHFQSCQQGKFVWQSRASLVGDLFLYSHDLNVWFRGDIVRRNWMLVTLRGKRVNKEEKITGEENVTFSSFNISWLFALAQRIKINCRCLHRWLLRWVWTQKNES